MLFDLLAYLTGVGVLAFAWLAWLWHRDPFHPMFCIGPMLLFLYSALPIVLIVGQPQQLRGYLSDSQLVYVQIVNLAGTLCICAGVLLGSGPASTRLRRQAEPPPVATSRRIVHAALGLGAVGLVAYACMLANVGGLGAAYGHPYGGGWADGGYVRDLQLLTIVALLLLLAARTGRRLSAADWGWVMLLASPWLLDGLLGARRGPTFMAVAVLFVGWHFVHGRRPPLIVVLGGGLLLGGLMLFLVDNRSRIYLGADLAIESLDTDPIDAIAQAQPGNDFIYGAGTILHADRTGEYWWGRRYLVVFFIKPIPRSLWPSKYQDASALFGVPDLRVNLGTGGPAFRSTLGWKGVHGSAPGIIADLWIEFWLGAFPVLLAFGWGYGRVWRRALGQGGAWTTIYCLMFALSVYLIMQSLNAMACRFLETAIPAWLAWRYALAPRSAAPGLGARPPAGPPAIMARP